LNPAVAEAFDRFYAVANLDEQMQAAEQVVPGLFEMVERNLEQPACPASGTIARRQSLHVTAAERVTSPEVRQTAEYECLLVH
jgi:hypothetical protein